MSQFFTLPVTGQQIPSVGFGTGTAWFKYGRDQLDESLVDILVSAIQQGFTHIDGAEVYNTALEIGAALKKAGKEREKLFLTDKYFAGDASFTSRSKEENPLEALKASLKKFETPYVDLYLLHSPFIKKESHGFSLEEAWAFLEEAQRLGLAKNIGVSNFAVEDLEKLLSVAKVKPQVNQIEYSAYLQNQTPGIVAFCKAQNILLEAYGPLGPVIQGKPGPLDDLLADLTKKYGKSESQILLRWVLQQGILPLTTSSKASRIKEYLELFDFELTKEEEDKISSLGKGKTVRRFWSNEYSKFD